MAVKIIIYGLRPTRANVVPLFTHKEQCRWRNIWKLEKDFVILHTDKQLKLIKNYEKDF